MLSENLELPASDCSWQVPLGMGDPERIPKGHPSRELSRLGTSRPRSQMTKTRVLSGYRLLICISTRTLWESSYFQVHYTQYVSEQICAFRGSLFNIFSICSWLQIYLFIYLFIYCYCCCCCSSSYYYQVELLEAIVVFNTFAVCGALSFLNAGPVPPLAIGAPCLPSCGFENYMFTIVYGRSRTY